MKKLIIVLLAMILTVSMVACNGDESPATTAPATTAAPTTEPVVTTETTVPAPQPADLYVPAVDSVNAAESITYNVSVTKKTTVGPDTYTETTNHTAAYSGRGTENATASIIEAIKIGNNTIDVEKTYADSSAYTSITSGEYGEGLFVTETDFESFSADQYPVALLDISLYSDVTMEEGEEETKFSFAGATAG